MKIEFGGGLEQLFDNKQTLELHFDEPEVTIQTVIEKLAQICNELRSNVCLFLQDGLVRPGILVLINDADWELLDKEDTVVEDKDTILFNSTLHGG
ncbi:ubiquitin-related modifier [Starmerella bacillaris]|uniref:Ubiquitin-related modifier 1 n=1 Tax=Starmerella bacillaris TaxID=1247836 RepID=A0AAV5RLN7_STABA|nr:ubiquitin-related modifier [Starmerella bacillaris]